MSRSAPMADEMFDADGLAGEVRRANDALGLHPIIALEPGESPAAVDRAEALLIDRAAELRIYQRAGEVVRIIALDTAEERGPVRKQAGTIQLVPVSAINLTESLDKLATWERVRETEKGPVSRRVDCPARIAMAYLARVGSWRLPELTGVVAAPIMRPDGTIVSTPGYDSATGLFLSGNGWPQIPDAPTGGDVHRAVAALRAPFAEFPFVAPEDYAVLLAAILTALQRRLLESAPLFGFTAPVMRSGKSLLSEAVAIIATGAPAPAMAVSGDREEIRKGVASILREGHAVINLDNIEHPLGSPDLARAITQPEYADRLLGESRLLRLPTNTMWMATGNNLAFRGDLAVRALLCRLDARVERPEERQFSIADLKAHIARHRPALVAAALTILRAYHVAGRPDQHLPAWGGFDAWSGLVRSALVWAGGADCCKTRVHIIEDDPDREQTATLLRAWHDVFGERATQLGAVVESAAKAPDLLAAIIAVAASKNDPRQADARRLGWWCRENTGRIVGGLRLSRERGGNHSGAAWRVSGVLGVSPPEAKMKNPDAEPKINFTEGCEIPKTPETPTAEQGVLL